MIPEDSVFRTNEPQVHIFMYRNNLEQKNQGTEKFKPNENIFIKVHGGTARRHLASGIDICGQPTKKNKNKNKTEQPKPQRQDSSHLWETVGECFGGMFLGRAQISWKPTSQALNHSSLVLCFIIYTFAIENFYRNKILHRKSKES